MQSTSGEEEMNGWLNRFLLLTESLYPVKTKWIVADFSKGEEIYAQIEKQLSGIPVGILGKKQRRHCDQINLK